LISQVTFRSHRWRAILQHLDRSAGCVPCMAACWIAMMVPSDVTSLSMLVLTIIHRHRQHRHLPLLLLELPTTVGQQ
jgi:hypothetical protein